MTSSWLASFVLIVVALGVMGVISAGVWLTFLCLSRFSSWRDQLGSPVLHGHPR